MTLEEIEGAHRIRLLLPFGGHVARNLIDKGHVHYGRRAGGPNDNPENASAVESFNKLPFLQSRTAADRRRPADGDARLLQSQEQAKSRENEG